MTQKQLIIPIIAVLFAVGIQQAYAYTEQIEITTTLDFVEKNCNWTSDPTGQFEGRAFYVCGWEFQMTLQEYYDAIKEETELEPDPEYFAELFEEPEIIEPETPESLTEQQIKVEGIITAREAVVAFGADPSLAETLCYGGTVRESSIYYPDTDTTIEIKRPNDNVPLKTNQQFRYEHLLSEMCKADYKLHNKVYNPTRTMSGEGEQYIFVPRTDYEGLIWDDLEGLDDPTYAHAEKGMTGFNIEKSTQTAETFKCSSLGKSMGHCRDPFSGEASPEDVITLGAEGKKLRDKYKAYVESGETEIPKQQPDEVFDPTTALDQYIKAYGITKEQLKEWFEARSP